MPTHSRTTPTRNAVTPILRSFESSGVRKGRLRSSTTRFYTSESLQEFLELMQGVIVENHPNLPRGLACFPYLLGTSSDSQSTNRLSNQVMRPFTLKATLRCYLQMIPALKVTAVNTKNLVNLLDTSLVCSTSRHFTRRLIGQLNTSVNTSVHSSRRPFIKSVHSAHRST